MYFSRELILSVLAATAVDHVLAAPVDKQMKRGTIATSGIPTVPSFPAGVDNSTNPTPQIGSSKSNVIHVSQNGQNLEASQISSNGISSIQESPAGINVDQVAGNNVNAPAIQDFSTASNSSSLPKNATISEPSASCEESWQTSLPEVTQVPLAKVTSADGDQHADLQARENHGSTLNNLRGSNEAVTSPLNAVQASPTNAAPSNGLQGAGFGAPDYASTPGNARFSVQTPTGPLNAVQASPTNATPSNGLQGAGFGAPDYASTPGNARFSVQTPTSTSLATQSA